jgi:hypothetical protein
MDGSATDAPQGCLLFCNNDLVARQLEKDHYQDCNHQQYNDRSQGIPARLQSI